MPHIALPAEYPGVRSPFMYSPATAKPLNDLVQTLLYDPATNRYVDGLATWAPDDPALYDSIGKQRASEGYLTKPFKVAQQQ
jgi:hypothetical protein